MLEQQGHSSQGSPTLLRDAIDPSASDSARTAVAPSSHDGNLYYNTTALQHILMEACQGFEPGVSVAQLLNAVHATFYAGISETEVWQALIMAARTRIEIEPAYIFVAARLLLFSLYKEVFRTTRETDASFADYADLYATWLPQYVQYGVEVGLLDERLLTFDLARLAQAIRPQRDLLFAYPGLQILYDRYLLQHAGRRFELPQLLWMRVAMGLALQEEQKEERAIEFYELISQCYFTPATPTLFNAGTQHPQLSSCYLTTIDDDLFHIFKCIQDNALLSKWAGGLGNDWSNIRALGAHIRGTNGISQGIIPFLKVANDAAVAVNQGGKRKGAVCAYLENWHLDIEEFLDLRKNTGDDRRRTHDMHTACWISDLFMQRVQRDEQWTLFSPDDVADLHDLYGQAFAQRYCEYEHMVDEGEITLFKRLPALELWRKMLTRLFETGHPWITWKDPSNLRSPQDHAGVIHSSNLCTEILLNTSPEETAVCNLGSINLAAHINDGRLDLQKLQTTIHTAVRMLDNVIDINYYPTAEARAANLRHRPIGLGMMAFQDALYKLGISYASQEAVEFADRSMEAISYYAISASSALAVERGTYSTYEGSKWQRGIFPIDSIVLLEEERGEAIEMDRSVTMDWAPVREAVKKYGMRNSNVMAIAPTATISSIIGASQSIEPTYKNIYAKSNLSGEFTTLNAFLVNDLKRLDLWNEGTLEALKYYDGSLQDLPFLSEEIKQRYLTAFDIDPSWLIECASRRQKWIDMGQSLNLYLYDPSGKKLHEMYFKAWRKGLKTTYYLRTLAATQVEKSTVDINRWGIQPRWMKNSSPSSAIHIERSVPSIETTSGNVCSLDGDCEACQ
jgi:ribonucleoside-diphosphate reductase alpha chain